MNQPIAPHWALRPAHGTVFHKIVLEQGLNNYSRIRRAHS